MQTGGITGLLFTDGLTEESAKWFARLRNVVDELLIYVDDEAATGETHQLAEAVATRVQRIPHRSFLEAHIQAHLRVVIEDCRTDWVLRIDSDEELGREWDNPRWHAALADREFTHYWLPRRWVSRAGHYLNVPPWYPDFQMRLFRTNAPLTYPTRLHEPMRVGGRGGSLHSLPIDHHVLRLCSRAAREAKVQKYERLRPGGALGHYYLFEDHAPPEAAIPPPDELDASTLISEMPELSPSDMKKVRATASSVPPVVSCQQLFWGDVEVTNNTSTCLHSAPPHGLNVGYHWLHHGSRQVALFDGIRSAIAPAVSPSSTRNVQVVIIAPDHPGDYILQVGLVQEGVRWFEEVSPEALTEFSVRVN